MTNSSPSNNLRIDPITGDKYHCPYCSGERTAPGQLEPHWTIHRMNQMGDHSSAAPKSAPTPVASNNLKEQLKDFKVIAEDGVEYVFTNTNIDQILNLILDTILASEEMQDDPAVDLPQTAENVEAFRAEVTRNYVKRQMRTMMEGLKQ